MYLSSDGRSSDFQADLKKKNRKNMEFIYLSYSFQERIGMEK